MLFHLPARPTSEVSHQLCSDCVTEELHALDQRERPKKNSALRLQLTCCPAKAQKMQLQINLLRHSGGNISLIFLLLFFSITVYSYKKIQIKRTLQDLYI